MAKRLPASVLEAKGAFEKDPKRKRVDPVATGDLGKAPSYFTDTQIRIWEELKCQLPVGLAKSADRCIFEIAVCLMDRFRSVGLKSTELAQLINTLGRLGMSPSDRSKCAVPPAPDPQGNEFSEFE
jgi:hypothetical protein